MRIRAVRSVVSALGITAAAAGAQGRPMIPTDPALSAWLAANARALPSMDAPYADSTWAWLRDAVGPARLLALGENIHVGHEPLAFRNHAIRYAVTQLGFTGVAIESGFSEGVTVDRFIQGEGREAAVDSVLDAGISYGFSRLPENRALVLWLREYNARASHKVHFYGIDQTGVGEQDMGGPRAIEDALAYLERVAPDAAARHRAALAPFLGRFAVGAYQDIPAGDRAVLHAALVALERTLHAGAAGLARATSARAQATARRNAWAARRLEEAFVLSKREGARAMATIRLRDSVMAENTRWALQQQGPRGKLVVFAHNGHALNVPLHFPAMGPPMVMMGQRLRAEFGNRMVGIGTASDAFVGLGDVLKDVSSWEGALARARGGNYRLDLRTADGAPRVAALLRAPWVTRIHAWIQPFSPRAAMDVVVVLDTIRVAALRK